VPGQASDCAVPCLPAKEHRSGLLYITCEQPSPEPPAALGQGSLLAGVRKKRMDGFQVASRSRCGASCILTSKEKHFGLRRNSSRVVSSKPSNVPMPAGNHYCKMCLWWPSPWQRDVLRCSDASPFSGWESQIQGEGMSWVQPGQD